MVIITGIVISMVIVFLLAVSRAVGPVGTVLGLALGSLCLYPQLLSEGSSIHHVGMAPPAPEVRTFTIVLFGVATICLLSRGLEGVSRWHLLLIVWLLFGMNALWSLGALGWSGVVQLLLGISAWVIGATIGWGIRRDGPASLLLAACLAGIVLVQLIVSCLQLAGVPINPLPLGDAGLLGERVNGTANHPNTLGKMLFLLAMLTLPLTNSRALLTKRLAMVSLCVGLLVIALTGGRANFFGSLLMISVWAVLMPRTSGLGLRIWFLGSAGFIGAAFLGVFLTRFMEDPVGGVRNEIANIALEQIPLRPLAGMGPNAYTSVVGPITGSWIPVHNAFLLAVAEIGLIGAFLLMAPPVASVARAWRLRRTLDAGGDAARAMISGAPGLLLIGLTGWGLLGSVILPLWFLVLGICTAQMRRSRDESGPQGGAKGTVATPEPWGRAAAVAGSH